MLPNHYQSFVLSLLSNTEWDGARTARLMHCMSLILVHSKHITVSYYVLWLAMAVLSSFFFLRKSFVCFSEYNYFFVGRGASRQGFSV
jgi:Na+/H+-dicarboxylate symporter